VLYTVLRNQSHNLTEGISPTRLYDVSEYMRLVDSRLFNRIQSPSHCLSPLLPPEKHHLGLRPRGHSYTLPICPDNLCKSYFIPRCLFCFLWSLLTVFPITVLLYYNICVCHMFIITIWHLYSTAYSTGERRNKLTANTTKIIFKN